MVAGSVLGWFVLVLMSASLLACGTFLAAGWRHQPPAGRAARGNALVAAWPVAFELPPLRPAGDPPELAVAVRDVLEVLAPAAAYRLVRFEIAVAPGLSVPGDNEAVQAMLGRLASHAVQQASEQVLVSAARLDGRVQIVVSDDGTGAAAATQQAALHDVAGWAASRGGSLAIDATPGQGTTVVMRLPDAATEVSRAGAVPAYRPHEQRSDVPSESGDLVTEASWDA